MRRRLASLLAAAILTVPLLFVFCASPASATSTANVPVSLPLSTSGSEQDARVAVSPSGLISVVWADQQATQSRIFYSHSSDGVTFTDRKWVDTAPGATLALNPDIAVNANGTIFVVWSDNHSSKFRAYISWSSDNGTSFSVPKAVTLTASGDQTRPALAIAGSMLYVVWSEMVPGKDTDIRLARSFDWGLTFGSSVRVDHTGSARAIQAWPAIDARGKDVIVAWHDNRTADALNIYASVSHNSGATFGPDVKVSDGPVNLGQTRPDVAYLPSGQPVVVWQDGRNGSAALEVRLATSTDGGVSFLRSVLVSSGPVGVSQTDPRVAIDSRGLIRVVYSDNRYSARDHVFLAASTTPASFPTNHMISDNLAAAQEVPDIALLPNGSAVAVFGDTRNGARNVYATMALNDPPTCSIISPLDGAIVAKSLTITGAAADSDGMPSYLHVEARMAAVGGSNDTGWLNVTGQAKWQLQLNTSLLPNGLYLISAQAYDGFAWSAEANVTVTVANERPPFIDLNITSDRIWILPSDPVDGDQAILSAEVWNDGTRDALEVPVLFTLDGTNLSSIVLPLVPAGGRAAASLNWTATVGNHTIMVQIDPEGLVAESNRSNNEAAGNFSVAVRPPTPYVDLSVVPADLFIGPTSPVTGDEVNVTALVRNVGTAAAANVSILFRIDGQYVAESVVPSVGADAFAVADFNWTATEGLHTVTVVVDPRNETGDARLGNNTASVEIRVTNPVHLLPDLEVSAANLSVDPAHLSEGQEASIGVIVSNLGQADAYGVDIEFLVDGSHLAWRRIDELSNQTGIGVSAPWAAVSGPHTVSVVLDPNGTIEESRRDNNNASKDVSVSAPALLLPDLYLDAGSFSLAPSEAKENQTLWINVTVQNIGNATAHAYAQLYIDGSPTGDPRFIGLTAGASARLAFELNATAGWHNATVRIDPTGSVREWREDNNNGTLPFRVMSSPPVTPDVPPAPLSPGLLLIVVVVAAAVLLVIVSWAARAMRKGQK